MLAKDALRQELAHRRAGAFKAFPDAGADLAANFPVSIKISAEIIIAGYMPFRTEIDPLPLMRALLKRGARCVLPKMTSPSPRGNGEDALTFHLCDLVNSDHFTANKLGLLEPQLDRPTATPSILLVPLLGFDRQGNRIGYGKGYYDKTIAQLGHNDITTIGLAFAQQEVPEIPTQPHDQRLDWIITQNEAYPVPS